jgi:LysM repeat protein
VIEKNDLHRFDVLLPQDVTAEELPEIPVSFYTESTDAEGVYFVDVERKVLQTNGVRYVLSAPGDTYRSLAAEFGLFRGELTRFNDVPRKAELVVGEKVYLERKAKKVAKTAPDNTVISGESLPDIAQRYGIRLQVLRSLNPGLEDYPAPATLVRLR